MSCRTLIFAFLLSGCQAATSNEEIPEDPEFILHVESQSLSNPVERGEVSAVKNFAFTNESETELGPLFTSTVVSRDDGVELGNLEAEFAIESDDCLGRVLAAGESCIVSAVFTPGEVGLSGAEILGIYVFDPDPEKSALGSATFSARASIEVNFQVNAGTTIVGVDGLINCGGGINNNADQCSATFSDGEPMLELTAGTAVQWSHLTSHDNFSSAQVELDRSRVIVVTRGLLLPDSEK